MILLWKLLRPLEFFLDEHVEGFDKKLLELGHKVHYAKKHKEKMKKGDRPSDQFMIIMIVRLSWRLRWNYK